MGFPPNMLHLPFYSTGSPYKKMNVEFFACAKPQIHLQEDTACHRECTFFALLIPAKPPYFQGCGFPATPNSLDFLLLMCLELWDSPWQGRNPKVTNFPQLRDACE